MISFSLKKWAIFLLSILFSFLCVHLETFCWEHHISVIIVIKRVNMVKSWNLVWIVWALGFRENLTQTKSWSSMVVFTNPCKPSILGHAEMIHICGWKILELLGIFFEKRLCLGHRFCSNKSKLLSDICQIPSSDSWPDPLVRGFFKFECRICLLFQEDS